MLFYKVVMFALCFIVLLSCIALSYYYFIKNQFFWNEWFLQYKINYTLCIV